MLERKHYIDFLKTIGLFGLFFAHVKSPDWLMMLRSFDVPMMVILSAVLANYTFHKADEKKLNKYIWKRIRRLVFPTWLFLTFFFLIQGAVGITYSWKYYLASYLLTRYGIGYVWIVLIYLYCAVLVPFLSPVRSRKGLWVIILVIYLLYEAAYFLKIGTENIVILNTVYYIIPYGVLTALGICHGHMEKKTKVLICAAAFTGFICAALYYRITCGSFQLVSIVKYPPRFYYLSYGIAFSFALLLLCQDKDWQIMKSRVVMFFSKHSFWIYLWHIFWIWIVGHFIDSNLWFLQWSLILIASAVTVWLQNKVLNWFEMIHKIKVPSFLRG